jgi:hypothetical protein
LFGKKTDGEAHPSALYESSMATVGYKDASSGSRIDLSPCIDLRRTSESYAFFFAPRSGFLHFAGCIRSSSTMALQPRMHYLPADFLERLHAGDTLVR